MAIAEVTSIGLSRATLWAPDLAEPLPARRWIYLWLCITSGRPCVFAGEGGSRKGWLALGLLLLGAADMPIFGQYSAIAGMRGLYLDWEQTEYETRLRLQGLCKGYGINLASLGKRLGYKWQPVPSLADRSQKTVDEMCRVVDGIDFCVIDSTRACSPGVDENSVGASAVGDLCLTVGEKTGTAFGLIDHSPKPSEGRSRAHAQRGHSSKRDISSTLLVLSAAKDEPTLVTCERSQVAAQSSWPTDFRFCLSSVNGGIVLTKITGEPIEREPLDEAIERVRAALKSHPGTPGIAALAERVKIRKSTVLAAFQSLEAAGEAVREELKESRGKACRLFLTKDLPDPTPF